MCSAIWSNTTVCRDVVPHTSVLQIWLPMFFFLNQYIYTYIFIANLIFINKRLNHWKTNTVSYFIDISKYSIANKTLEKNDIHILNVFFFLYSLLPPAEKTEKLRKITNKRRHRPNETCDEQARLAFHLFQLWRLFSRDLLTNRGGGGGGLGLRSSDHLARRAGSSLRSHRYLHVTVA